MSLRRADLSRGKLEVAEALEGSIMTHTTVTIPDMALHLFVSMYVSMYVHI